MAVSNTISGGGLTNAITFTQYGSQYAANYSNALEAGVLAAFATGETVTPVSEGGGTAFFPEVKGDVSVPPVYLLEPSTVTGLTSQDFTIATAGYVLDTVGGSVVINVDTAGGDSILVSADNPSTTVNSAGSDNLIVFIDGNNLYNGDSSSGDTVVGGTGNDTINTGTGSTTVNAGTGYDIIYLNDTVTTSAYQDAAYLDTGHDLVVAQGFGDLVVATTESETVTGGGSEVAGDNLTVVLLPNSDGTANGYDLITGGNAYLTVGDESSDNTIIGGAGGLTFIGGVGITADVSIGTGGGLIFGTDGDSIQAGGAGSGVFVAGAGNETLNGALTTGSETLYGAQTPDANATDVLTAGSGTDLLVAGAGSETLTGGAGTDTFLIDAYGSVNATLTIGDFGGNDSVAFGHYSADDVATALANGTDVNGNFVITFAESSTTITFTGITSASQLDGHIITF
jgi:Ca2+-binding RTX toxin-like protein